MRRLGRRQRSSAATTAALSIIATPTLSISNIATSGDFSQTNNCGTSLAAGVHCAISVTFTPTATGTRTGTLTVSDNASNSPQTVSLSGTGVGAASLSPTALTFSSQIVGTSSAAQAITLTNSSGAALSISSVSISGNNPGDFAQSNNCGSSVSVNSSCAISVAFTPTATGTRTATLTVTDSASNSPQTVGLTGTGAAASSPPTFVQVQNNYDKSPTAYTSFSVNIATQPGDLLVAFVRESSNGTDNFTVTDSAGQIWTQTASGYKNESSTGPRIGMFYVANSAAVSSVTVNYTTSGGVIKPGIMVMEFSGAAASSVADGSVNNASGASVTTSSSGSLTTTNANDILIFATDTGGNETGWTAGPGYAIPNNKLMVGASGSNARMAMQFAVVSAAQTNAMTSMSYLNSAWNGNIFAAFK